MPHLANKQIRSFSKTVNRSMISQRDCTSCVEQDLVGFEGDGLVVQPNVWCHKGHGFKIAPHQPMKVPHALFPL